MASSEKIAFEPSLAHVLAKHFHDPSVMTQMFVDLESLFHPFFIADLVQGFEAVRSSLIRPKNPEILAGKILLHHIAQKDSHHTRCFSQLCSGPFYVDGILAKVGHN